MASRREILAGALADMVTLPAFAQADDAGITIARFPLWPGTPPGGAGLNVTDETVKRSPNGAADDIAWPHIATPTLTAAIPAKPTGAAVLICPGGGFTRVAVGRTGGSMLRDFAREGITAFELLYRLPHDGWAGGPDTPLQDAQRAMRVIRSGGDGRLGARWAIDPTQVAALGFSAGGHVAARLAARSSLATYAPVDSIDRLPARPTLAGLFFPVITMLDDGVHVASRRELLGDHAAVLDWQRRYSAQLDLPADMPPCYVACNADDPVVPARNSVLMYEALHAAKVRTQLAIYEKGGHGPPAAHANGAPVLWMDQFRAWARDHRWPA